MKPSKDASIFCVLDLHIRILDSERGYVDLPPLFKENEKKCSHNVFVPFLFAF